MGCICLHTITDHTSPVTTTTIEHVRRVLAAHPKIDLAYVFGSVALERARPESDVDVAVQATTPIGTSLRMQLIEELALATGRPVDLIDLRTIGEPLLGQILKYSRQIIGSPATHVSLVSRHVYADPRSIHHHQGTRTERVGGSRRPTGRPYTPTWRSQRLSAGATA